MLSWKARRALVVLAVLAAFAFGGSVVLAAIPTGGGTIYACYGKSSGAMRVVNYPSVKCTSSERLLSWTQVGPKAPPLAAIGIQTFGHLDNSFDVNLDPNATILRVWAETGSASAKCLATLAEALQPAPRVDQLFCASRRLTVDGTARDGVYLTMILQEQLRDGSYYDVNVYQEGARFYGTPIKCDPTIEGC